MVITKTGECISVSDLVRVAPGGLVVGKPLPWTVYDLSGNVLLRQGHVIHSESQLEQLFERALFYPRKPVVVKPEQVEEIRLYNPFEEYPSLLQELEATLTAISDSESDAPQRLSALARLIDDVCLSAPDPSLALVHLYAVEPTAYEQTLFYAIICHFTARAMGLEEKRVLALLGAALTANLALLPFLDKLNRSSRRLTDQQRQVIRKHPLLSAKALRKAGIKNRQLLTIIEQHHEHHDGNGYPAGLTSENIEPEAQILALAELYTAMITRRAYRDRLTVSDAMKAIRNAALDSPRPGISSALLSALTPYPPGCLVRLANSEVAVVTHRPARSSGPTAQAIIGPKGDLYSGAFKRDSSLLEFSIRMVEDVDVLPSMDFGLLWELA